MPKIVLVDTSFLITVYDDTRPNHTTAKQYHDYFLNNEIAMYLSSVVVSEFHQGSTAATLLSSGLYVPLPFNIPDAVMVATISHALGNDARRGGSRPEFRDDIKLMAQAERQNIDFIITDDHSTLARYCERLTEAGMFNPKVIKLNEPFDMAWFNASGQSSLL